MSHVLDRFGFSRQIFINVSNIKIRATFFQWEARWCIRRKDRRTCQAHSRSSRLNETAYPVNDRYNFYISIVKSTSCANVTNLFYFRMTLYLFRTVFPSIISSSRLYIQQQSYVKQILLSAWMTLGSKYFGAILNILMWNLCKCISWCDN